MIRNVVTCAKSILFMLNIWVLCVVLVVVLGKWQIFETKDMTPTYDASHLVVMRELKEDDQQSLFQSAVVKSPSIQSLPKLVQHELQQVPKTAVKVDAVSEDRQDRIETMRQWCRKIRPNLPDAGLIQANKLQQIIVDDKHKVMFCQVPGAALNDLRKMAIYLSGAVKVKSHLEIPVSDLFSKYNKQIKKLSDYSGVERKKRIKSYFRVSFVREPLERLYSSYENKFKAKWATYFHLKYGTKIIKKYRKKPSKKSLQKGNDVTFPEFIQYVVDAENQGEYLNEHWAQIYSQCHPCLIPYDFVGKYETLNSDIDSVLTTMKVRNKFKGDLVSTNYTYPKNILTQAYKGVPESNLRKLWKMYYPDYNLFNYPFPDVLKELVKTQKFNDY